jgi:hypothetical protein
MESSSLEPSPQEVDRRHYQKKRLDASSGRVSVMRVPLYRAGEDALIENVRDAMRRCNMLQQKRHDMPLSKERP